MRRRLPAYTVAALALTLLSVSSFASIGAASSPAKPAEPAAGDELSVQEQAEELAGEAMEQLMRTLKMFMRSIPQYELPEINENGDIIIRRKRDDPGEPDDSEAREPEVEQT